MIKKQKLSLSILNSLLLIVFLVVVTLAILLSTYVNTQKVIDKNIDDYFNQTYNLTNLILDNEQNLLENVANEIGYSLYVDGELNDFDSLISNMDKSELIDDIDLLFIKTKDEVIDYSNSLFDTDLIINEITKQNLSLSNTLLNINIGEESIILMISSKKIVDYNTGRVNAIFYTGKIFNDNFSLLNNIKQKAKLNDVYLFFDGKIIASTNSNDIISFDMFSEKTTVSNDKLIFSNKSISINDKKLLDFVFVSQNSIFDILKESFIKQSLLLLLFVVLSFLLLYFLSNKYIIKPFAKLLDYAYKIKDHEDTRYEETQVLEFDQFAYELKDIINELRDVKEQYSRAIDGVQDGLWDIDIKRKKIFYSTRFMSMLGYEKKDRINHISFWQKNIHKSDYKKTILNLREHVSNKTDLFESEYRFKCKDGSYKWIKIRGKIFFDENGNANRMTGFHTDIDDLVKLQKENINKEQMLYQQSKLASMGEMIGNIAHQWRQPLTVISVIASTISMQLQLNTLEKDSANKDLNKLLDTVQYLSSIIDKFRHFFNPDNKVEEFYFSDAIKDNMEIFESSYKSNNINLILDLDDILINGYKFELMQVIINIINNSRDALISKLLNEDQEKYIFMKTSVKNSILTIKIYDNAGGIPNNIKDKIYEPYFTTKHQSQGTGLGLYMSNEIIQKHFNGKLENKTISYTYEEKEYKGEEFTIEIPI